MRRALQRTLLDKGRFGRPNQPPILPAKFSPPPLVEAISEAKGVLCYFAVAKSLGITGSGGVYLIDFAFDMSFNAPKIFSCRRKGKARVTV